MTDVNPANMSLSHLTAPARTGEPPYPGLLLLHGRGTDETDLLPLAQELDGRLYVITARGPYAFPWGGSAWYDMDPRGVGYPNIETLYRSISLLEDFITEMLQAYPIDPNQLYAGGFSQGSAMAASLALTDPERVAGAIILSGYLPLHADLPIQPDAAAGQPIFQAHGTLDPVIPIEWARETRDYLAGTPVELEYHEYPIQHTISQAELADLNDWLARVLQG